MFVYSHIWKPPARPCCPYRLVRVLRFARKTSERAISALHVCCCHPGDRSSAGGGRVGGMTRYARARRHRRGASSSASFFSWDSSVLKPSSSLPDISAKSSVGLPEPRGVAMSSAREAKLPCGIQARAVNDVRSAGQMEADEPSRSCSTLWCIDKPKMVRAHCGWHAIVSTSTMLWRIDERL